jgi:DNA topoisomerase-1
LLKTPGERLFRYRDANAWSDLSAPLLIAYVRQNLGPFAVKDFRTWGATLRAATVLAELEPPRSDRDAKRNIALAMRIVASELGNTAAICRTSYVHPMVLARYVDEGETIALRHPRHRLRDPDAALAHSPEERALIAFLDTHFPERRRRPRHAMARAA